MRPKDKIRILGLAPTRRLLGLRIPRPLQKPVALAGRLLGNVWVVTLIGGVVVSWIAWMLFPR
jgi:hypothetical protein